MQYFHTPIRMANIETKIGITTYLQGMQDIWKSHALLMGMQSGSASLENSGSFL